MSRTGRLNLPHTNSTDTIKVALMDVDRNKMWNGSSFVAVSSLTDVQWTAALIAATAVSTSDATKTCLYVADIPAAVDLDVNEDYAALWYVGASPAPGDRPRGVQSVPARGLTATGQAALGTSGSSYVSSEGTVVTTH